MDRRQFLLGMAGAGLVQVGSASWAASSLSGTTNRKMIVIMLRGAIDGLSVVIPYGDPNYFRLRPDIAIARPGQEMGALDLDGYFGLHPALANLTKYWNAKELAFVHAAGSPDTTRSHFEAQDYMESGTPGRKSTPDGWMNRLITVLPGMSAPTRAVSIGPAMPRILSGNAVVTNVATGDMSAHATALDNPKVANAFDKLYQTADKYGETYRQGQASRRAVAASLDREMQNVDRGAPLPGKFPKEAMKVATLFRNNADIQLAFMAVGGWDTHANQGGATGQLANHLTSLGQGLAMLADHLGPLLDETIIVVMSEFGRTVRQNGNLGTDHGHGNVMWLLGGKIAGKTIYGEWKGLATSALFEGRDLPVTTDYRSVMAEIALGHLELAERNLPIVFPGIKTSTSKLHILKA